MGRLSWTASSIGDLGIEISHLESGTTKFMPLLWPARRIAPNTPMTTLVIRVSKTNDVGVAAYINDLYVISGPNNPAYKICSKYKGDLQMKMSQRFAASGVLALIMGAACFGQHYTQTNLVSSESGVAPVTDPQLINPWGISRGSGSAWWVSDQRTGLSTLYDGAGVKRSLVVTIPQADPNNKNTPLGTPTGTIANSSQTDFLLAPAKPALFLFSTIDGTIAGWNPTVAVAQGAAPPSTQAVTLVKTSDGSSYTGLTSAFIEGNRFLYAANFTKGRVDVYDNAFHLVNLRKQHFNEDSDDHDNGRSAEDSFVDENLPHNYVPFNVQTIGNDIVVTYALHEEGARFETDGPGLGFVDIYSSSGQLLQRLEHGDWLNAPWGVALAPLDFGRFSHDLLIGQF